MNATAARKRGPKGGGPEWTPEEVDGLTALVDEHLGVVVIARRLGISKQAVIGKLSRLGSAA